MTAANRDADRLVRAFLEEGPAEMPSPLAARIRAEVEVTSQRARFRPWRNPAMPRTFWMLAPAAALVIALAVMILGGGSHPAPIATPIATALPSPSREATPAPTASPFALAPGEAWILIGESNQTTFIRPDGTGRHSIPFQVGVAVVNPVWSADGNQVVYEGNGTRGSQLWVQDADGANARQLTPTPDGCPDAVCVEAVNPAWSPDGTRIAYIAPQHDAGSFTRTALMVYDLATAASTEIYATTDTGLGRPTWSPDGRSIAIEVDRFVAVVEGTLKDTAIGIVNVDGVDHSPRMITDPGLLAGFPVWHPSSDLIVFRTNPLDNSTEEVLDTSAPSDVYTIHADGSGLTNLTNNTAGGRVVRAPSWTQDGRILFTARATSLADEYLRLMDADGTNEASATGAVDTKGQGRWRPGT